MIGKQLELFEGQEISITTDKGIKMINLANSARVLGLIRKRGNNSVIRWDDVKKKINTICSSAESSTQQDIVEESKYILDEIENADDRSSIYMSRKLTSLLAMECHNDKATQYKTWLATLDEKVSEQPPLSIDQRMLTNLVTETINNVVPSLTENIVKTFAPVVAESKQAVEDMRNMLGSRNRTTQVYCKKLIERECSFYGRRIFGTSLGHRLNKGKVFNHFNVASFDDIPMIKFNEVVDFIEKMELIPKEIINKYYEK